MSITTYLVLLSKMLWSDSPAMATLGGKYEKTGEKLMVVVFEAEDDIHDLTVTKTIRLKPQIVILQQVCSGWLSFVKIKRN